MKPFFICQDKETRQYLWIAFKVWEHKNRTERFSDLRFTQDLPATALSSSTGLVGFPWDLPNCTERNNAFRGHIKAETCGKLSGKPANGLNKGHSALHIRSIGT